MAIEIPRQLCFATLATLILISVACSGDEPHYGGLPRTQWASKLTAGTIKLLSVGGYISLHDTHELSRRFDIEARCVATTHHLDADKFGITGHYWPELLRTRDQILGEIREALQSDWDVLALGSAPGWGAYPDDLRNAMISSVASGKTMVISVHPAVEEDFAAAGHPLQQIELDASRFSEDETTEKPRLYRCGRGYVMHWQLNAPPQVFQFIPPSGGLADFEYRAARAGWYLLRAAHPDTKAAIDSVKAADGSVTVTCARDSFVSGGKLHLAVRRRETFDSPVAFDDCLLQATKKVSPGASWSTVLPKLPAGDYQAEVRVTDRDGRTLDWDAVRFSIQSPVKLERVTLDRKTVDPGERVTCKLQAEGPVDGARIRIRWYDHWGRLLSDNPMDSYSESFSLTVPAGSLSVINHVQVTVSPRNGPDVIATAEILTPENTRPLDDFSVLYWRTGAAGHTAWQWDALRRSGAADAFCNTGTSEGDARDAANCHLRTVPYTTSFHQMQIQRLLVDEEGMAKTEQAARQTARDHSLYATLAYTLGDENYMTGFEEGGRFLDHPRVWEKFRVFLRELYPDIHALNAQWDSNFADFDSIRFETEKQMLGSTENPSAWVDFRFFIERAYAELHNRMRNAIRQEHPGALVGFDGAEQYSSYDGYDWWQLAREMDMVNVYHVYLLPFRYPNKIFNAHAAESFAANAVMRGCWLNSADLRYGGEYDPWYLLLNGWNSVWWWYATFLHPANGALQWDMQPTPIVREMAKSAFEIKSGPATLLAHAEKQYDPIAVYYSSANWHASTIESGVGNHINNLGLGTELWMADSLITDKQQKDLWGEISPKGHYAAASRSFYVMLHDMGLKPRTIARQDIEGEALARLGIKVFVLPFVVSLSDAEAEKIRAFVKAGGMVIADYRCGLRDGHCRVRETGALDDVFGIKRKDLDVRRKPGVTAINLTDTGVAARFDCTFHEAILPDGAAVHGTNEDGLGAFFINHAFGEGRALYLNADIYEYLRMRKEGRESDLRETLREVMTSPYQSRGALLSAPFVPEHEKGHPLDRTEVTRFRDGDTWYFGVLPDYAVNDKSAKPAVLPFPAGRHVYDVRTHRYMGVGGPLWATIQPGRAEMYAALPYEITGISVAGPRAAERGKRIELSLQVQVSEGRPGSHAARLRLLRPDGEPTQYDSRTVYLPHGRGTFDFTLALNEPAGKWVVEVTECVSGRKARHEVRVR